MRTSFISICLISGILFTPSAQACSPYKAPAHFTATSSKNITKLLGEAMAVMDRDMAKVPNTGNAEQDFLAMMIPHHQGAIDMAKSVLAHAKDEYVRGLALEMIADQTREIEIMKGWLARLKAGKTASE